MLMLALYFRSFFFTSGSPNQNLLRCSAPPAAVQGDAQRATAAENKLFTIILIKK